MIYSFSGSMVLLASLCLSEKSWNTCTRMNKNIPGSLLRYLRAYAYCLVNFFRVYTYLWFCAHYDLLSMVDKKTFSNNVKVLQFLWKISDSWDIRPHLEFNGETIIVLFKEMATTLPLWQLQLKVEKYLNPEISLAFLPYLFISDFLKLR